MNMGKFKIVILFALFWNCSAYGLQAGQYQAGFGIYTPNWLATSKNSSSEVGFFGQESYPFYLRAVWTGWGGYLFTPRLLYTLIPRELQDTAGTSSLLGLSLPFTSIAASGRWDWSWGLSWWQQTIKGKGGTVVGQNAGSPTVFYRPDRTVSSRFFTVDLGLGWNWSPQWRSDLELHLAGVLSERRAYHVFVTLSYVFSSWGLSAGGVE